MVSFVCGRCEDTVKKPAVKKHLTRCKGASLTCLDCYSQFSAVSVQQHNSCISEAEKVGPRNTAADSMANKSKSKKRNNKAKAKAKPTPRQKNTKQEEVVAERQDVADNLGSAPSPKAAKNPKSKRQQSAAAEAPPKPTASEKLDQKAAQQDNSSKGSKKKGKRGKEGTTKPSASNATQPTKKAKKSANSAEGESQNKSKKRKLVEQAQEAEHAPATKKVKKQEDKTNRLLLPEERIYEIFKNLVGQNAKLTAKKNLVGKTCDAVFRELRPRYGQFINDLFVAHAEDFEIREKGAKKKKFIKLKEGKQ